jgi:hypothetical protein
MSRTACSGSAVESTIIALSPPVSAISIASGAAVFGELPLDDARHLGRTGEADAGDARIGRQRRADRWPVAGNEMQHLRGTPACHISSTARAAISGVCSAGLATPHCRSPVPPRPGP